MGFPPGMPCQTRPASEPLSVLYGNDIGNAVKSQRCRIFVLIEAPLSLCIYKNCRISSTSFSSSLISRFAMSFDFSSAASY